MNPYPSGRWTETDKVNCLKEADSKLIAHYAALHDRLSDMIESGRLTKENCPADYQWLVDSLVKANGLYYQTRRA